MSKTLNEILDSDEFKTAHSTAKALFKNTMVDIDLQTPLTNSDTANLFMLLTSLSMYYKMRDEVEAEGYCLKNRKGYSVHPLMASMTKQMSLALKILDSFGGNKLSKLRLNKKELVKAEDSPFDELMRNNQDEEDF